MELSTTEFLSLFLTAVNLYYPESANPNLQPSDTPKSELRLYYDFIIVGAGSAGCVVANRLSEIPNWKIILIEAGGDEDAISEAPHLQPHLGNSEKNWNYTTAKQERACLSSNGICQYPRGRVMGGSSTINAMMYVRGNRADYDAWAAAGNQGWSYKDVLPYFIKAENNTIKELQNSTFHGYEGYLNVEYPKYLSPLAEKYIQAGKEYGWEEGDFNGENQERIGLLQHTMDGPSRESTSKAYLNPIRSRTNLSVLKKAVVTKLIIQDNIVKGVEYFKNGKKHRVFAKKEVILSAGAIDTPKILMLSGVGPKEELIKHNITPRANLPVGKHLQDHLLLPVFFEIGKNVTLTKSKWKNEDSILKYVVNKEGPISTFGSEVMAFLNVLNKTNLPDLQLTFLSTEGGGSRLSSNRPIITVFLSNIYPYSLGSVRLKSANWTDPPLINPNYFDVYSDFEVFEKGFELILDYMNTPTMKSLSAKFYEKHYEKCPWNRYFKRTDYIKCIIMNYSNTIYHPVSTVKMGPLDKDDSAVTSNLLVKGFKNLRVIDASVMPNIVRGNTNAPVIMIGEKGADIVKEHYN